jgi:hypothetical protein
MADAERLYYEDDAVAETLAIEQRLRDNGYANLADILKLGGDFDFEGSTIEDIVQEAATLLRHQESVDLAGARILAALGETAVKAQAFDAIAALLRQQAKPGTRTRR